MKALGHSLALLLLALPSLAMAQAEPQVQVEPLQAEDDPNFELDILTRDATMPAGTLAVRWDVRLDRPRDQVVEDSVNLGVAYSPIDRLELGASLVPMNLGFFDTEVDYLDPSLYARYLIFRGPNEIYIEAGSTIPLGDESSALIQFSVLTDLRRGDSLFSTGLITHTELGDETTISMSIPSLFYYSISDNLYAMLGSGFIAQDIESIEETWSLPLYSEVGLSFGDEQPAFDLWMGLEFPRFIHNDGSDTNVWSIQVSSRAYLWL